MITLKNNQGFTIFEVLIVIGISTALLALVLPVGFRFFQFQVADETATGMISVFHNAESRARLGMEGDAFGVKLLPDSYVLFQGDSYAARVVSHDETFSLPLSTNIESNTDEFVFAQVTGIPSATGTIAVTLYERTHTIEINAAGVITQN